MGQVDYVSYRNGTWPTRFAPGVGSALVPSVPAYRIGWLGAGAPRGPRAPAAPSTPASPFFPPRASTTKNQLASTARAWGWSHARHFRPWYAPTPDSPLLAF